MGGQFIVIMIPINFMVEPEKLNKVLPDNYNYKKLSSVYYSRLEVLLMNRNVDFINIEKSMKSSNDGPFFPVNGEVHFNPNGNKFTAEQVYIWLAEHNIVM